MRTNDIGVTLGDPCGIGPEIAIEALRSAPPEIARRAVVFGDAAVVERAGGVPAPARLVDPEVISSAEIERVAPPGRPSRRAGVAQIAYLEAAVAAARRGEIGALATAPISKRAAQAAGFGFPGHTEFLAHRFGARRVAMMFAGPRLKVALATVHVALAEVPAALAPSGGTRSSIEDTVELLADALIRDFGLNAPRIGVLGLNPHAGEGGIFGREEIEVVAPAIERLRARLAGVAEVTGPLVPDAAFRGALAATEIGEPPPRHDALVALYHDQGLIPVKLVDFEEAVNVTLGLPIVRTSPDHGVAYDLAGTGRARATSMRAALRLADELGRRRS